MAMTTSTASSESRPRSLVKEAVGVTWTTSKVSELSFDELQKRQKKEGVHYLGRVNLLERGENFEDPRLDGLAVESSRRVEAKGSCQARGSYESRPTCDGGDNGTGCETEHVRGGLEWTRVVVERRGRAARTPFAFDRDRLITCPSLVHRVHIQ